MGGDAPKVVYDKNSTLSPLIKKGSEVMDPYVLEDNVREALGGIEGGRDVTKSAKTVMKRNH